MADGDDREEMIIDYLGDGMYRFENAGDYRVFVDRDPMYGQTGLPAALIRRVPLASAGWVQSEMYHIGTKRWIPSAMELSELIEDEWVYEIDTSTTDRRSAD